MKISKKYLQKLVKEESAKILAEEEGPRAGPRPEWQNLEINKKRKFISDFINNKKTSIGYIDWMDDVGMRHDEFLELIKADRTNGLKIIADTYSNKIIDSETTVLDQAAGMAADDINKQLDAEAAAEAEADLTKATPDVANPEDVLADKGFTALQVVNAMKEKMVDQITQRQQRGRGGRELSPRMQLRIKAMVDRKFDQYAGVPTLMVGPNGDQWVLQSRKPGHPDIALYANDLKLQATATRGEKDDAVEVYQENTRISKQALKAIIAEETSKTLQEIGPDGPMIGDIDSASAVASPSEGAPGFNAIAMAADSSQGPLKDAFTAIADAFVNIEQGRRPFELPEDVPPGAREDEIPDMPPAISLSDLNNPLQEYIERHFKARSS